LSYLADGDPPASAVGSLRRSLSDVARHQPVVAGEFATHDDDDTAAAIVTPGVMI
jgi:hypothetical protein